MSQSTVREVQSYDDGLIYIHNHIAKNTIFVHFRSSIQSNRVLCQELGEILHYISTYRSSKIILVLNNLSDFANRYEQIGLHFFQILSLLGVKHIGFVASKQQNSKLCSLIDNHQLHIDTFENITDSIAWVEKDNM